MLEWYEDWLQIHPGNISGFHIGRRNGRGRYTIIFHLVEKHPLGEVQEQNLIPPYLEVPFPDGKARKIKTDVQQTGQGDLQFALCHKVLANGDRSLGTVGVFVRDTFNQVYAVTNYHVAAWNHMLKYKFHFKGNEPGVVVGTTNGNLITGAFTKEIDFAFVKVHNSGGASNSFGDGNSISSFFLGPISPGVINRAAKVYSRYKPNGVSTIIRDNEAVFVTNFMGLKLEKMIMLDRVTYPGDSGSAVMIGDNLLALIVGADDFYTYAFPYHKINSVLPYTII